MSQSAQDVRVLVVCSDSDRRQSLRETLESAFDIRTAADIATAIEHVESDTTDCMVATHHLTDGDGIELIERVRSRAPDLPIVFTPRSGSESLAAEATGAGATDYLPAGAVGDGTLRDRVTAAVETYRRRRRQATDSDMFTSMLESLPVPLYVKDDQARHLRHSDVPGGIDPERTIGKTDPEIFRHDLVEQSYADDLDVIETGEPIERKSEMHTVGDVPTWLETTKVPWRDDEGTIKGLLGISYEVTSLKRRERELRRRIHRLERFASYVSHDLRTPLQVADGKVELARTHLPGDSERARAALADGSEALDRMNALIDDLHDLAESAGSVEGDETLSPVALPHLVESVWERIETGAATLHIELPAETIVYAVESHLYPFFENLFKNAIDHAGPDCTVSVTARNDGFAVTDDGPGIPPEERDRVTEPQYTNSDDGTGTGLSMVADIASAYGWSIDIGESDAGGASFRFRNCLLVTDPTVRGATGDPLPLTDDTDVGDVRVAGSATYDAETGVWTVAGGGEDLWRDINEFHYVYRTVEAPIRITARVADIDPVDEYSKAGVMVRDGVGSEDTFGFVGRTAERGAEVLWRTAAGEVTRSQQLGFAEGARQCRLDVVGDRVTAFVNVDGEWQPIDQRSIDSDETLTVGLAVCSVTQRYLTEATFENVRIERLEDGRSPTG